MKLIKQDEIVEKKSRFVALRFELDELSDVDEILTKLKVEHKKARHVCFGYVFSLGFVSEKCSDAGEPKGTAGYPILNVIKKKNLTNTLIVVVRYFGGILLGAGGLTRAYTKAAASVAD